jgi:hypothetical protein
MKKPLLLISGVTIILLFLSSCNSSKVLQKEIRTMRTDLFYELTTPVYQESIKYNIYLNFYKKNIRII